MNSYENGVFIIKDNTNEENTIYSGSEMNQKIRTFESYKMLFELAGFKMTYSEDTKDWPQNSYMLKSFILNK